MNEDWDMEKKKNVFLFGAGATIAWGSPATPDLTHLVRKPRFKTIDNKTTITEYIYQQLLSNGYTEKDINFETLINVIEELIVYYSQFNDEKKLPSLISCFFTPRFENELFNFSIKGGEKRHGFQLQIPKGVDYEFSEFSYNNETPEQFFLIHLLREIFTDIGARISKYAYHSEEYSVVNKNSIESELFCKWMESLSEKKILRLYTLNYERLFKVLLEQRGISVFEGFDCGENVPLGSHLRANVKKIISDYESNVHYNLHGSAFWEVLDLDNNQLPNPEIVLSDGVNLMINNGLASYQIEKGKTLLVTSLITGYQKSQRSMLTPFKQMQSAFDKDCCFADEIYIVGYSFGDEHINQSIKTAIRYNKNVRITIIDPDFIKAEMEKEVMFKFFSFREDGLVGFNKKKVGENVYSYYSNSFLVYTLKFEEFLKTVLEPDFIVRDSLLRKRVTGR